MKNRTKKLFKITGITLGALIVFLSAVIAFSIILYLRLKN